MKAKLIRKFKKSHSRLKYKAQRGQARSRISWFVKSNQDKDKDQTTTN
ncbi:MAG: hypothetical protein ACI9LM_001831 [Alteromonadaceae bacterium]|jgi:hypothetical protein